MAACASSSWPLPTYPADPWDRTQNLTETVLFSGAKGSGSPGNIIGPLTEQLPCTGTLLVLLTCWVLIFTNLPLSLPPFYRLTLVGLRLLEKHQTWISDVPAWPNSIQVTDCNHRALYGSAWTLATAPCLPSPLLPLLLRYPWNCLPAPTPGPLSQENPAAVPSLPWLGSPSPSCQTSLRPALFTSHLACGIFLLQLAMCCQRQQCNHKSWDILWHPAQCQAIKHSKVTTLRQKASKHQKHLSHPWSPLFLLCVVSHALPMKRRVKAR